MDRHDLKRIWQAVDQRLSGVDFQAIWPGFSPVDFALYRSGIMCYRGELSARPGSFWGNTVVEYEGTPIAIWDMAYTRIDRGDSLDRLSANLIHEMFHAFQHRQGETRFAKDLELLLYPRNEIPVAWTARESAILSEAALDDSEDKKEKAMDALRSIAAIRSEKTRLTDGATINEFRVETTEGLAEYAAYLGLTQINHDLAALQLLRYKDQLFDGDFLFDFRRRCYFSGILLAVTADKAGFAVTHDLKETKTFWDLLAVTPGLVKPLSSQELSLAASLTAVENERLAGLLAGFQARFPVKQLLDARIVGYDPMNLTRVGDYLISTHLLMIEADGKRETYTGDHLFLMKAGEVRRLEAVFFESP